MSLYLALWGLLASTALLWSGYVLLPWSGAGLPSVFSWFWLFAVLLSAVSFARKYGQKRRLLMSRKYWSKRRSKRRKEGKQAARRRMMSQGGSSLE